MSTAEDRNQTVLERKVIAQRRALGVGAVSVPRALGRSLSIAADALWALGLVATVRNDAPLLSARALSDLTGDQMLVLLEKDDAPCGLAAFDRALVTGLTEVQTLGKVTRFPLEDRPYTATDAAMVAPLLDAALHRFSSMLAGQPDLAHLQGYGFGALVEDPQAAGLVLDAGTSHVIGFDIGLAQDLRVGRAVFLFPQPEEKPAADPMKSGKYEAVMKLVPTRMQAILTRIHLPLEKAQALQPGDLLDISNDALAATALVVAGGHVAARGQINGYRAVRIGCDAALVHPPAAEAKTAPVPAVVPTSAAPDLDGLRNLTLDSHPAGAG